jgi:hypothetical protein
MNGYREQDYPYGLVPGLYCSRLGHMDTLLRIGQRLKFH